MAISLQAVPTTVLSGAATTPFSGNVYVAPGLNTVLVVAVGYEGAAGGGGGVTSVTFGKLNLTRINATRPASFSGTEIWYLVSPPVGNNLLTVTMAANSNSFEFGAYVLDGVDQTTVFRTPVAISSSASGTVDTLTINNVASTDFLIDTIDIDGSGHSAVTSQTSGWVVETGASKTTSASSYKLNPTNGFMGWTWTTAAPYSHIAVAFIAATTTPSYAGPVKIATGLGALPANSAATQLVRTSTGNLYAALLVGSLVKVYKSNNQGISWAQQDYANAQPSGGTVVAAAIDGADVIHIIYQDKATIRLAYLKYSTSTDTFGRPELTHPNAVSNAFGSVAIAIDSKNIAHVVRGNTGTADTSYANRIGGFWKNVQIVAGSSSFLDIQIDNNNAPNVTRAGGSTFIYQGNKNDASSFTAKTITGLGTTGTGASISMDPAGNVWVVWQEGISSRITLAQHKPANSWAVWQTPIDNGANGKNPSIAADVNDVYIFYERNNGGLAYDRYDTLNGKWLGEVIIQPTTSTLTSNFRPHNPFVKWSQYWNNGDTGANNSAQDTIEYLFDDGSTVYYDRVVTAQISTGFAEIKFSPAAVATTTSTSSTSSSTSTSISTSSTSTSTSFSTSSTSTSISTSSTSTSISTSSTSSSTSISTSSTSTSASTSVSTSSTSTSVSTSFSTSSTSTSRSTSSTSTSTSFSTSSTSTSISTSSTSSSTSISTSSTSTSTSLSTSSTSTSISTSSTSISTSISTSSTSTSISTSSTSTSVSTSSTSTSVSTSTSISTSSTSTSTSLSTSTSSTSTSISTSSTSTSISTSSTSTSTSLSTSSTSTSISTSTTVSATTSTSSTSTSTSVSTSSTSTSISTSSTSSSTSLSTSSTSTSLSTSSTSTSFSTSSTSTSLSTSSTSTSISTTSTSSSTSLSTSSTSTSTTVSATTTSTSSTSSSTSTSFSTSSTSTSTSFSTSSTSSSTSISTSSTSTSLSTSSTSTSTTISTTTSTSSTSTSISSSTSTSSTSSSTSVSTSSSTSTSISSTSSSTSTSTTVIDINLRLRTTIKPDSPHSSVVVDGVRSGMRDETPIVRNIKLRLR